MTSDPIFFMLPPEQRPDRLEPAIENTYRWATVVSTGPLVIQFDGDTDPLASTPDSLVVPAVADRVWCQLYGRRVIVLGVGQPA